MSRPTIVYVGGFELPDKNAAAQRVLGNAKALRELGFDVVLVGISQDASCVALERCEQPTAGFDSWQVPYPTSTSGWSRYVTSARHVEQVVERYKGTVAVACYNYPAVALWRLLRYCQRHGLKCMADCTEWYDTPAGVALSAAAKWLDTLLRMRVVHKRLDGIICISSYLEKYYAGYLPTVRIPPLVDLSDAKWQVRPSSRDDAETVLVYAGSPGGTKDRLDWAFDALADLGRDKNWVFRVVGLWREEFLSMHPEYESALSWFGDRVSFLGRLPHLDTLAQIRSADYTVFLRECHRANQAGFPTKFVESVTCGTPVITTDCSDVREFADEGRAAQLIEFSRESVGSALGDVLRSSVGAPHRIHSGTFDYRAYVKCLDGFVRDAGLSAAREGQTTHSSRSHRAGGGLIS